MYIHILKNNLNTMKTNISIITSLLLALFITSCSNSDNQNPHTQPPTTKNIITTYEQEGITYTILSNQKQLWAPYTNAISIKIQSKESLNKLYIENFQWKLIMHMSMNEHIMTHSAPSTLATIDPIDTNLIHGSIMPTMPGNELGSNYWSLNITYKLQDKHMQVEIPLLIDPTTSSQKTNLTWFKSNNQTYYLALINPTTPKTGENPLQIGIYNSLDNAQNYQEVPDLLLGVDPRMPDMGNHGVNKVIQDLHYSTTESLYSGVLPLTMSGFWLINLIVYDQDNRIIAGNKVQDSTNSSLYLELEF